METIADKIKHVTSIYSPSGGEFSLRNLLKRKLEDFADEIIEDVLGNLIVHKYAKRKDSEETLMLVAHMDEVAMMVSYIDENGYLRVSNVGGVDANIMKGRKVVVLHEGNYVHGVIGVHPFHMLKEMPKKEVDFSDLWIDIAASNKSEAEKMVSVGDYVLIDSNVQFLANNCVSSRACDDKVGVVILWDILEKIFSSDIDTNIVAVFSVQEEVGLRGAKVASFNIRPDYCIAIDVVHASDYPNVDKYKYGQIGIGNGPVIPLGTNFTLSVQKNLMNAAEKESITFQRLALPISSGTDINAAQTSSIGCKTGLVAIPCRYMHSPVEVISIQDVENCIKLLLQFVKQYK